MAITCTVGYTWTTGEKITAAKLNSAPIVPGITLAASSSITTVGGFALTLTMSGATNVTFPTSGTLAALAASASFTTLSATTSLTVTGTGSFTGALTVSQGAGINLVNGGATTQAINFKNSSNALIQQILYDDSNGFLTVGGGGGSNYNVKVRVNATTVGDFSSTGLAVTGTINCDGGAWFGSAALATGATTGHVYIQTCAGTPTGVPASKTGQVAFQYDTTNNKLYVYNGAWKATVALT